MAKIEASDKAADTLPAHIGRRFGDISLKLLHIHQINKLEVRH